MIDWHSKEMAALSEWRELKMSSKRFYDFMYSIHCFYPLPKDHPLAQQNEEAARVGEQQNCGERE